MDAFFLSPNIHYTNDLKTNEIVAFYCICVFFLLTGGSPPQNNVQCTNGPPNVPKSYSRGSPSLFVQRGSPPIVQFHVFRRPHIFCIFCNAFQRFLDVCIKTRRNKNTTKRLLKVKQNCRNGGGDNFTMGPPLIVLQILYNNFLYNGVTSPIV